MLYDTAARSAEVLALDVEDLDLPNRQAKMRRKGGTVDVIIWRPGPVQLPAGRRPVLQGLRGATLHQLRHSVLTHDAEHGTGTPMLMARSGHTSIRSLAKLRQSVGRGARPPPGRTRPSTASVVSVCTPRSGCG